MKKEKRGRKTVVFDKVPINEGEWLGLVEAEASSGRDRLTIKKAGERGDIKTLKAGTRTLYFMKKNT